MNPRPAQARPQRTDLTLPAVVVGMELNGLGVARALHASRIPVIGLAAPPAAAPCRTRTASVRYLSDWTEDAVITALLEVASNFEAPLPLLLTKDEAVLWVSRNRRILAPRFHLGLPSADVVELLMSKSRFLDLADKEGWPVPGTVSVRSAQELAAKLGHVRYPCILKPQIKNSTFRQRSPRKAFKARTPEEVSRVYDLIAQWEPEVVIQEWIPGGDDRVIFCLGYWGRHGEPKALFTGRKLRQWPIECGNTALCEPFNGPSADVLRDLTREVFSRVQMRGLGSLECKLRLDGTLAIMEPTVGRTNFQSEVAVVNGCNIPSCAYADLTGVELTWLSPGPRPVKLVEGMADLRAALEYRRQGTLSLAQWIRSRSGPKRYMLLRGSDLRPAASLLGDLVSRTTRKLRKILSRIRG